MPGAVAAATVDASKPVTSRDDNAAATAPVPASAPAPAGPTQPSAPAIIQETTLRINVSGLMFETPVCILRRDPDSLLAQLCNGLPGGGPGVPPLLADPEGFFYFDRDWWLFRYLLQFLRDGSLPDDRSLLAQLYREAGFFHLGEMQKAIEEEKLHLRAPPSSSGSSSGGGSSNGNGSGKDKDGKEVKVDGKEEATKWWRTLPTWTQAVEESKKKEEEKKKEGGKDDWWTGASYKGKTYLPLSSDPEKVVTRAGEKDEQAVPRGTWSYARPPEEDAQYGHGHGYGAGYGQPQLQAQQGYVYGIPSSYSQHPPSANAGGGGGGSGSYPSYGRSGGGGGPSLYDPYAHGGGRYGADRLGGLDPYPNPNANPNPYPATRAAQPYPPPYSAYATSAPPSSQLPQTHTQSQSQQSLGARPMGQLDVTAAMSATRSRYPERDILLTGDGELYPYPYPADSKP